MHANVCTGQPEATGPPFHSGQYRVAGACISQRDSNQIDLTNSLADTITQLIVRWKK